MCGRPCIESLRRLEPGPAHREWRYVKKDERLILSEREWCRRERERERERKNENSSVVVETGR